MRADVALTVHLSAAPPAPVASTRLALPLLGFTALAVLGAVASWWHLWRTEAATGVVNLVVAVSFMITATVLHADPHQRRTAREIGFSTPFYLTSWGWTWPPEWQHSPLPLVSFAGGYLWFVFLGSALTRYPHNRLDRRYERFLLLGFGAWIVGMKLVLAALSQPEWAGFAPGAWWLTVAPDLPVFTLLTTIFNGVLVVFVVGLLTVLLLKIRRSLGVDRIDALPAVMAASAIALVGVPYVITKILGLPGGVQDALRVATALAALCTPISFLAVVVRQYVIRSAAAEVLPRIYYAPTVHDVRAELRRTLQDPALDLWFWRAAEGRHLDIDGHAAEPTGAGGRFLVDVRSAADRPLAVMGTSTSLQRHRKLVESAAYALGLAMERQAGAAAAAASSARLGEAELSARRAVARDLHDGAQQILLTAQLRLAVAQRRADPATLDAIEHARADVTAALGVIRGLASGKASEGGLTAALAELAGTAEIPVELGVTDEELPTRIQRQLWFIVSEGLTNIRKHARAATAAVSVERSGDDVVVHILDDGRGGADAARGSGLAGLAERVHELHGSLQVVSPVGGGTTITARFPCA
ncbi:sensor histidine kinase [Pseudonocardia sp. GCM10023141]|uniref:sensor histidine kinase n=1 Tax=Pseudonocardia sp. GCM10023141 TaxID=3252653 RepID=UPI0036245AD4